MTKEVNFVPYQPVLLEFVVSVLRPIQKCSCFVSVQILAVPKLFQAYRDKYQVSAVKQIPGETEKLKKPPKFQDPPPHSYLGFSSSSSYLSLLCISSSFPLFRRPLFLQPLHLLHLFLNMSVSLFSFGTLTRKQKSSQSRSK